MEVANVDQPEKANDAELSSSLHLPLNTISMLAYATGAIPYIGWMTGLLVLFLEKDKRVRFHAYQSLALFGILDVLMVLIDLTVILNRFNQIIMVVRFVTWLLLLLRTYEGKKWELPIVGEWASRQLK